MNKGKSFDSVWDALEDDPATREVMKIRSQLLTAVTEAIKKSDVSAFTLLAGYGITREQVHAINEGKISEFTVESLIRLCSDLGLKVTVNV